MKTMIKVTNKVDGREIYIDPEHIVSIVTCPDGVGSIIETVVANWICPVNERVDELIELMGASIRHFEEDDQEDSTADAEEEEEEDEEEE